MANITVYNNDFTWLIFMGSLMYSSLNRIAKEKPLLALVVISLNPNAVTPILTLTPALTLSLTQT